MKDRTVLGLDQLLQPGTTVILLADGSGQTQAAVSQLQENVFPVVGVVEGSIAAASSKRRISPTLVNVPEDIVGYRNAGLTLQFPEEIPNLKGESI